MIFQQACLDSCLFATLMIRLMMLVITVVILVIELVMLVIGRAMLVIGVPKYHNHKPVFMRVAIVLLLLLLLLCFRAIC